MTSVGLNQPYRGAPAGQRGGLHIYDKVVDAIVEHETLAVNGVVPHASTVEKVTGRSLPRIDSQVAGESLRLRLDIAVLWQTDVGQVAREVRDRLTQRLGHLTGYRVDGVDIHVPTVVRESASQEPKRRVQ